MQFFKQRQEQIIWFLQEQSDIDTYAKIAAEMAETITNEGEPVVNLIKLASQFGVKRIIYCNNEPTGQYNGHYGGGSQLIRILYDPQYYSKNDRFLQETLAHEIGHAVLSYFGVSYNHNYRHFSQQEMFAQVFARTLLLPDRLIQRLLSQTGYTVDEQGNLQYRKGEYPLLHQNELPPQTGLRAVLHLIKYIHETQNIPLFLIVKRLQEFGILQDRTIVLTRIGNKIKQETYCPNDWGGNSDYATINTHLTLENLGLDPKQFLEGDHEMTPDFMVIYEDTMGDRMAHNIRIVSKALPNYRTTVIIIQNTHGARIIDLPEMARQQNDWGQSSRDIFG